MTVAPPNILNLFQLSLWAVSIAYVITGTKIGFPLRVLGFHALKWCPLPLSTVFFCPSCNAWWQGAAIGILAGWEWPAVVQLAFTSCLLAAIMQLQWGLAADDEEVVANLFDRKKVGQDDKANGRNWQGGSQGN